MYQAVRPTSRCRSRAVRTTPPTHLRPWHPHIRCTCALRLCFALLLALPTRARLSSLPLLSLMCAPARSRQLQCRLCGPSPQGCERGAALLVHDAAIHGRVPRHKRAARGQGAHAAARRGRRCCACARRADGGRRGGGRGRADGGMSSLQARGHWPGVMPELFKFIGMSNPSEFRQCVACAAGVRVVARGGRRNQRTLTTERN